MYAHFWSMLIGFRPFACSRWMMAVSLCVLLSMSVATARRSYQKAETQRLVADIDLLASAGRGYGTEVRPAEATAKDLAWKEYCYRQRESLMQEARVATR